MIKIEIVIKDVKASDTGKPVGQMTALHYNHPPVTPQELWLRNVIFDLLEKLGMKLGEGEGASAVTARIPHNPNKRRKNDNRSDTRGNQDKMR
jgi:hypothetical protein